MGDVIRFGKNDSEAVVSAIRETLDHLEAAADVLQDEIVGIAMSGVWKEWSDNCPVGTLLKVDRKMISETGDARINRLLQTLREMRTALVDLERYRAHDPAKNNAVPK